MSNKSNRIPCDVYDEDIGVYIEKNIIPNEKEYHKFCFESQYSFECSICHQKGIIVKRRNPNSDGYHCYFRADKHEDWCWASKKGKGSKEIKSGEIGFDFFSVHSSVDKTLVPKLRKASKENNTVEEEKGNRKKRKVHFSNATDFKKKFTVDVLLDFLELSEDQEIIIRENGKELKIKKKDMLIYDKHIPEVIRGSKILIDYNQPKFIEKTEIESENSVIFAIPGTYASKLVKLVFSNNEEFENFRAEKLRQREVMIFNETLYQRSKEEYKLKRKNKMVPIFALNLRKNQEVSDYYTEIAKKYAVHNNKKPLEKTVYIADVSEDCYFWVDAQIAKMFDD